MEHQAKLIHHWTIAQFDRFLSHGPDRETSEFGAPKNPSLSKKLFSRSAPTPSSSKSSKLSKSIVSQNSQQIVQRCAWHREANACLHSPLFGTDRIQFFLTLFPNGAGDENRGNVSIYCILDECVRNIVRLRIRLSLLDRCRRRANLRESIAVYNLEMDEYRWGYHQFVSHRELSESSDQLMPRNRLTLMVEIDQIAPRSILLTELPAPSPTPEADGNSCRSSSGSKPSKVTLRTKSIFELHQLCHIWTIESISEYLPPHGVLQWKRSISSKSFGAASGRVTFELKAFPNGDGEVNRDWFSLFLLLRHLDRRPPPRLALNGFGLRFDDEPEPADISSSSSCEGSCSTGVKTVVPKATAKKEEKGKEKKGKEKEKSQNNNKNNNNNNSNQQKMIVEDQTIEINYRLAILDADSLRVLASQKCTRLYDLSIGDDGHQWPWHIPLRELIRANDSTPLDNIIIFCEISEGPDPEARPDSGQQLSSFFSTLLHPVSENHPHNPHNQNQRTKSAAQQQQMLLIDESVQSQSRTSIHVIRLDHRWCTTYEPISFGWNIFRIAFNPISCSSSSSSPAFSFRTHTCSSASTASTTHFEHRQSSPFASDARPNIRFTFRLYPAGIDRQSNHISLLLTPQLPPSCNEDVRFRYQLQIEKRPTIKSKPNRKRNPLARAPPLLLPPSIVYRAKSSPSGSRFADCLEGKIEVHNISYRTLEQDNEICVRYNVDHNDNNNNNNNNNDNDNESNSKAIICVKNSRSSKKKSSNKSYDILVRCEIEIFEDAITVEEIAL